MRWWLLEAFQGPEAVELWSCRTQLRVGRSSSSVFPSLTGLERQVVCPHVVQPAAGQRSSSQARLTLPWSLRSLETILAPPSSGAEA